MVSEVTNKLSSQGLVPCVMSNPFSEVHPSEDPPTQCQVNESSLLLSLRPRVRLTASEAVNKMPRSVLGKGFNRIRVPIG